VRAAHLHDPVGPQSTGHPGMSDLRTTLANWARSTLTGTSRSCRTAPQLPVMWQPWGVYSLTEVADNLKGVLPQSSTLSINPRTVTS
jgi:hypothetical protein